MLQFPIYIYIYIYMKRTKTIFMLIIDENIDDYVLLIWTIFLDHFLDRFLDHFIGGEVDH